MRGFSKTAFSAALVAAVLSFGGVAYAENVATVQTRALSFGAWCLFIGGLLFLVVVVVSATRIVPQGKAGVVERFGRYVKTEQAGLVMMLPLVSTLRMVSLKEQVDEYQPQSVITSDNVGIHIDAVLFFQIVDPVKSIYEVENFFVALEMLTMTTLRDIIGEMSLDECLTSRERINARLRSVLDDVTAKWGIKVNRVEIRTIEPPAEIQTAMEKQMRAERDKRARILEAEGDRQAAILRAEGDKQSAILEAEGEREAAVLTAQGRARAYRELFTGIRESNIDDRVIAIRYLEALERVADGKSMKLLLPYEATGILGALSGIAAAVKDQLDYGDGDAAKAAAAAASAHGVDGGAVPPRPAATPKPQAPPGSAPPAGTGAPPPRQP